MSLTEIAPMTTEITAEMLNGVDLDGLAELDFSLHQRVVFFRDEMKRLEQDNTPLNRRLARTAACVIGEYFSPDFVATA